VMAVLDRPVGTGFRLLRLELNAEGLAMLRVSPLWGPAQPLAADDKGATDSPETAAL
jgi:hypothetical protein